MLVVTTDVERQQVPDLQQIVVHRDLIGIVVGRDGLLAGFVLGDEVADVVAELARRPRRRLRDGAVAGLPEAGPVLAHHQAGIAVDIGEHVDCRLIGGELRRIVRYLLIARALAGGWIEIRIGLVPQPSAVVILRRSHHRHVRSRTFELPVAPMGGEQPGQLGMIILRDHHRRAVRLVANDHANSVRTLIVSCWLP